MNPFDYILWFLFGSKKRSLAILKLIIIEIILFEICLGYFF